MRRGFYPSIYFEGETLVAFGTGSDACAEHECGVQPLIDSLCESPSFKEEQKLFERLKKGKKVKYPSILDTKRIVKFPQTLCFETSCVAGEPEAILAVGVDRIDPYLRSELDFRNGSSVNDANLAGAWDERSFAFRVRGERYVKGLTGFYTALKAKKVLFGGTFFKRDQCRLSGIVLVNSAHFSSEDMQRIEKAQRESESKLRLRVRDDSGALTREVNKAYVGEDSSRFVDVGYIWARWKDESESEIVYCLNPGYQVNAEYWGPYTREELLAWARAKGTYRLTPKAAARAA